MAIGSRPRIESHAMSHHHRAGSSQVSDAEEAAALADLTATKSALFARPSGAASGAADESEETARAAAEASLAQLSLDLGTGGDGADDTDGSGGPLDLTTAERDLDFELLGVDPQRFDELEADMASKQVHSFTDYREAVERDLAHTERMCVEDYLKDADQLCDLHGQIKSCDSILATMESMLAHFQGDLSAISQEIAYLQEKSYGMNIKLRNSKSAEKALNHFIQHIYIPDDLCNLVLEGDINEPFVNGLVELDRKLLFLDARTAQGGAAPFSLAARDMAPIGEKLKLKSIARIRAFLLERFHSLKKPKTNIQIKQKLLLKFSFMYQFLLHHADEAGVGGGASGLPPMLAAQGSQGSLRDVGAASGGAGDICGEIRREYHETISTIYHAKFKKYLGELRKLQMEPKVDKADTLGNEEGAGSKNASSGSGGGFSGMFGLGGMFGAKKSALEVDAVFRLQGREEVLLGQPDALPGAGAASDRDLIIPHLAGAPGASGAAAAKMPFEKLFRSAQSLLMDTATSEYDFIVEFFGERMARDMDRAGLHEDALAAEKELELQQERDGVKKAPSSPSYVQNQADERGREHLLAHSRDKHLFGLVFGRTIALFLEHLDNFLFTCHDALTILVLIRIVCQHNIQMQYRRVHCLDQVFDRMNMMLWPRFKQIFDENVASVMKLQHADVKPPGGGPNSSKAYKPHFVGTRYAEFAAGILTLNEGYDDDILVANLKRLRGEVDKFLQRSADRLAATLPSAQAGKQRLVFLLNNYHSILHVLCAHRSAAASSSSSSSASQGHANSEDAKYWRDAIGVQTSKLVDEELGEVFPSLLQFLGAMGEEESRSRREARPVRLDGALAFAKFRDQVVAFQRGWQDGIQRLHQDIVRHFTQEDGGARGSSSASTSSASAASAAASASSSREHVDDMFMRALSQLLLNREKLEMAWRTHFKPALPQQEQKAIEQLLVTNATMSIEVKKYRM